tara:strand:- start:314 stop:487 length:174 start_codon:yes stop_codon:yes gene_type:complete
MGVRLPSFDAVRILPVAFEASKALLIWGRANDMGLPLEVGARYSIQSLRAIFFPSNA